MTQPPAEAIFAWFASLPANFESDALAVIAAGLERGAGETDIRRTARLLQAYELFFWQTVAR